jgi:cell division protein FtsW
VIGTSSRRRPAVMQRGVSQRRHRPDYVLLVLSAILLVIGLVVIYSISPGLAVQRHVSENYYAVKQMIAIGLGIITFGVMATVPYDTWRKLQKPLIGAAILATVIALAMPVSEQYPAHRWIRLGGLSFQSVELIKFAIIFVFAAFLTERIKRGEVFHKEKALKPIAIAFGVMAFMIAGLQSDLGSTGVIIAMVGAMWFVAGLPAKYIMMGVAGIALVFLLAISTSGYRRDRMLTFLHPERDCSAAGYQACQALIAVGSGGLFGKGVGQSVQAYGYLPEAANDSIFAILAEKFGFVGVTALLCVFWAFFTRLKNIMERAPDDFSRLVVAGILAWLSTQAIINIGAMIGLLPLKGITLPLISYGGTSIIFVTGAIGLVYNISRYTTYGVNEGASESRIPPQTNRRYSVVTPGGR